MNKILKEEIERFQLLSIYDNKKTLDENYDNVLNEQGLFGNLFRFGTREAGTLSRAAIREIEELFRLVPTEMRRFGVDAAEITAKLEAKSFTSTELGAFRKTVFKNTQNTTVRKEIANDMVSSKAFEDFFSTTKESKVIDELVRKGYSGNDAKLLMDTYKRNGGKFLDEIGSNLVNTGRRTQTNASWGSARNQRRYSSYYDDIGRYSNSERKTWARSAYEMLGDILKGAGNSISFVVKNFFRLLGIATTIGIAYYLWHYMNNKFNIFPKCLSPDNIPKKNWEEMYNENLGYVKTSETGNDFIDDNGGGRFYADKKFETDNGKFKGTWKNDSDDSDIIVTLSNGEEQIVLCQAIHDFIDPRDPREDEVVVKSPQQIEKERIISSWGGKYQECDDFPMEIGCINDGVIGTIQDCFDIPRDGKFSPQVLDALEKNGYGFTLSFDSYKRIKNKCGMSSSQSGFASTI